jgi:hypothetical protein
VVSFMPRPLYPQRKSPWYPLYKRLDGRQSQSGHGGEERICQPLPGLERPIVQPVSQRYTTGLFHYYYYYYYYYSSYMPQRISKLLLGRP